MNKDIKFPNDKKNCSWGIKGTHDLLSPPPPDHTPPWPSPAPDHHLPLTITCSWLSPLPAHHLPLTITSPLEPLLWKIHDIVFYYWCPLPGGPQYCVRVDEKVFLPPFFSRSSDKLNKSSRQPNSSPGVRHNKTLDI